MNATLSMPVHTDRAHDAALKAFFEAIERNDNRLMPLAGASCLRLPMSVLFGSCSDAAAKLLFDACHMAHSECHPNVRAEWDRAAAAALRKFVDTVAREYADDHAERFQ